MKIDFKFISKYIKYKLTAKHKHGHGIHSPFIYTLLRQAIEGKQTSPGFAEIEKCRKEFLRNSEIIEVEDLGAGSKNAKTNQRKISNIAHSALTQKKYTQLLFRLVNYLKPKIILEFGTSLGITTMYLAEGNPEGLITTMEGSLKITDLAKTNFSKLNYNNISTVVGNFDEILPEILKTKPTLDFVFFDGNHKKEPTLRYFEACLPLKSNESLFVFDDIHWSEGMENAWDEIKKHQETVVTIDLFFFGLVFFRKEMSKQNYIIKF